MLKKLLGAAALTAIMAVSAFAADKPAIVFDIGGKFDKSFNESMFGGAEKFKKESGVAYGEFEIANEAQREQAKGVATVINIGVTEEGSQKNHQRMGQRLHIKQDLRGASVGWHEGHQIEAGQAAHLEILAHTIMCPNIFDRAHLRRIHTPCRP